MLPTWNDGMLESWNNGQKHLTSALQQGQGEEKPTAYQKIVHLQVARFGLRRTRQHKVGRKKNENWIFPCDSSCYTCIINLLQFYETFFPVLQPELK